MKRQRQQMPQALPAFHALTGCDTVSGMHKIGKKTAYKTLALRPQTVDPLRDLAEGNITDSKKELLRFIMALYSPARRFGTLTECRRALFASSSTRSLDAIPPTEDAALLHLLRASYRAQGWRQLVVKHQALPSPADWGYTQSHDGWKVGHRTKPTAAEACKDIIVKCSCKVSCQGNCSCREKKQKCIDLCSCPCVKN
ncbi:hypothetical protein FOCC_FOCC006471 [Frankliniella occidentalis]|nr:hypothetical protein FOCC_FOCC006471 [Frankliniella occidentalis]